MSGFDFSIFSLRCMLNVLSDGKTNTSVTLVRGFEASTALSLAVRMIEVRTQSKVPSWHLHRDSVTKNKSHKSPLVIPSEVH